MSVPGDGSAHAVQAAKAQVEEGLGLIAQRRVDEALALADELLAGHGEDAHVLLFGSKACLASDDAERALELVDRAIASSGPSVELLQHKAFVLMGLMRRADARNIAAEIAAMGGGLSPDALWAAGRIHSRCDAPAEAAACFEKALQAGCTDLGIRYDLATAHFFLGNFERAEHHLDALLSRAPASGDALYLRATVRRQTPARNHVADLEARLKSGIRNPLDVAGCLYALAKELEDIGEHGKSFAALGRGAAIKRGTLAYDAAAERATIDRIRSAYTAQAVHDGIGGHGNAEAIFVVGMPRTGTTLVERILGGHSRVAPVGELPYFGGALATAAGRRMRETGAATMVDASLQIDFAALGRAYMAGAQQAAGTSMRVTVDKMPINFMYCGLIRKALPGARIVHLVRDPMDACYAIYKTLFQRAYYFSNDLGELGAYYAIYHRLMRHWHEVMPDSILDVRYEDLVTDTEDQARRLLAWCGLPWEPGVEAVEKNGRPSTTASAAQVRAPVHASSIGKWRHHEKGLAPLRRFLLEAGVVAGD